MYLYLRYISKVYFPFSMLRKIMWFRASDTESTDLESLPASENI